MDGIIPLNIIPDVIIKHNGALPQTHIFSDLFDADISIYIHFPFCMDKCPFCPIKTTRYRSDLVSDYITSLNNEIYFVMKELECYNLNVKCIHFGGGTPSLIEASQLDSVFRILSSFINIDSLEIVFEMHPKFVTHELLTYLAGLRNCTVNFGVKSFDSLTLLSMNRNYQANDLLCIIESAKKMVNAIGIDYICDWPTSDLSTIETDIKYIEMIRPDQVSQYPLQIGADCFTGKNRSFCKKKMEDINQKIALNQACEKWLMDIGYHRYSTFHYEDGKTVSHLYGRNQLAGGKWIGFGSEAYTYLGNVMCVNSRIEDYVKGQFMSKEYKLNYTERFLWEFLFLLRMVSTSRKEIIKKYGEEISVFLDAAIQKLQDNNYINSAENIGLTWNGIVNLSNVEQMVKSVFK